MPDAGPERTTRSVVPEANAAVAARFRRLAELLELEGANLFRARAYRTAAASVEALPVDVATLARSPEGRRRLDGLRGIGADLAGKIAEICRTGRLGALEAAEGRLPPALVELSALPGLGPVRLRRLRLELGVTTPEELRKVIATGELRRLGFGRDLERRLADALSARRPARWRRALALPQAQDLLAAVRALPGVQSADIAGSLRRGLASVGDADLVAAAPADCGVTTAFAALRQVAAVLACGPTRASVRMASGLQADLLVVEPKSYGAALLHFTGSKAHNIALRQRAHAQGLKLNEYGLWRGRRRLAGRTEAEIYRALGLVPIPARRREDRGEIEQAAAAFDTSPMKP